jgi:hypothetical protein
LGWDLRANFPGQLFWLAAIPAVALAGCADYAPQSVGGSQEPEYTLCELLASGRVICPVSPPVPPIPPVADNSEPPPSTPLPPHAVCLGGREDNPCPVVMIPPPPDTPDKAQDGDAAPAQPEPSFHTSLLPRAAPQAPPDNFDNGSAGQQPPAAPQPAPVPPRSPPPNVEARQTPPPSTPPVTDNPPADHCGWWRLCNLWE